MIARERRVVDDRPVEGQYGGHPADRELRQGPPGTLQRLRAARPGDDQLADQRVERLRHRLSRPVPRVEPDAGP